MQPQGPWPTRGERPPGGRGQWPADARPADTRALWRKGARASVPGLGPTARSGADCGARDGHAADEKGWHGRGRKGNGQRPGAQWRRVAARRDLLREDVLAARMGSGGAGGADARAWLLRNSGLRAALKAQGAPAVHGAGSTVLRSVAQQAGRRARRPAAHTMGTQALLARADGAVKACDTGVERRGGCRPCWIQVTALPFVVLPPAVILRQATGWARRPPTRQAWLSSSAAEDTAQADRPPPDRPYGWRSTTSGAQPASRPPTTGTHQPDGCPIGTGAAHSRVLAASFAARCDGCAVYLPCGPVHAAFDPLGRASSQARQAATPGPLAR